jgi:integrase/recombinase XerD
MIAAANLSDTLIMFISTISKEGNKDRQVPLNTPIINILTQYYRHYRPEIYVFNGQLSLQYSDRSVGKVIKQLSVKAGISKRVYTHLIRHCSFTHLLESGVELSIIQKIAGHGNIKTTQGYTHISSNLLSKVYTPINNIRI